MTTTENVEPDTLPRERTDLLESLGRHRFFLRFTADGLTDEQAASRPTASQLSIGGLIKHVTATEKQWAAFIVEGAAAMASGAEGGISEEQMAQWASGFALLPEETLAGVLAGYAEVAARTDALVGSLADLPDLDAEHALPSAPWFAPGATWSARRVLLHIIAETAQHAGHADILRETIDGQKTMG